MHTQKVAIRRSFPPSPRCKLDYFPTNAGLFPNVCLVPTAYSFPVSHVTGSQVSILTRKQQQLIICATFRLQEGEKQQYFTHSRQRADFVKFTSHFKTVKWFNLSVSCICKMYCFTLPSMLESVQLVRPWLDHFFKLSQHQSCPPCALSHSQTKLKFNCGRGSRKTAQEPSSLKYITLQLVACLKLKFDKSVSCDC